MICPAAARLQELLDLTLERGEEARLRTHLASCVTCREALLALEPAGLLLAAGVEPLADAEWSAVMARVREEVAQHPRGRAAGGSGWLAWLGLEPGAGWRLLRAAPAGAAAVALALGLWLGAQGARRPAGEPAPGALAARSAGASFEYLSNPAAAVSSVLIQGTGSAGPVELTMVVDARIADVF